MCRAHISRAFILYSFFPFLSAALRRFYTADEDIFALYRFYDSRLSTASYAQAD